MLREALASVVRAGRQAVSRRAPRQVTVVQQRVRGRFDAATSTDDSRHWANADALSANAALAPEIRRTIRNRARYERANSSYFHGICTTKSNDLIGTGPRWLPDTGSVEADRILARRWFDWSWAVRLAGKLRTATESRVVDGEAFARLFTNPRLDAHGVQLDLLLVESDQVATPSYQYHDSIYPDGSIADGLEFDAVGNVIAYHILRSHPGANYQFDALTADRYDADQVIHWFRPTRPGQSRGLSELTSCLRLGANLRRYTEAVIRAAEIAAEMALFLKTNSPAATVDEVEPFNAIDLEKGTMTTLPEGWNAEMLRAEQPTNTHAAFTRTIVGEITRGVNLPYHLGAFDASSYNYSSARLDGQLHAQNVRVERDELERVWLDHMLRAWLDEAALIPGFIPAGLRPVAEWNWSWVWDGREHIDPVKEANAVETQLATLTTSLTDEYARRGKDVTVELQKIAAERQLMESLGLSIGDRPSQVAVPEPVNASRGGEDE